jgi:hypothetical protein
MYGFLRKKILKHCKMVSPGLRNADANFGTGTYRMPSLNSIDTSGFTGTVPRPVNLDTPRIDAGNRLKIRISSIEVSSDFQTRTNGFNDAQIERAIGKELRDSLLTELDSNPIDGEGTIPDARQRIIDEINFLKESCFATTNARFSLNIFGANGRELNATQRTSLNILAGLMSVDSSKSTFNNIQSGGSTRQYSENIDNLRDIALDEVQSNKMADFLRNPSSDVGLQADSPKLKADIIHKLTLAKMLTFTGTDGAIARGQVIREVKRAMGDADNIFEGNPQKLPSQAAIPDLQFTPGGQNMIKMVTQIGRYYKSSSGVDPKGIISDLLKEASDPSANNDYFIVPEGMDLTSETNFDFNNQDGTTGTTGVSDLVGQRQKSHSRVAHMSLALDYIMGADWNSDATWRQMGYDPTDVPQATKDSYVGVGKSFKDAYMDLTPEQKKALAEQSAWSLKCGWNCFLALTFAGTVAYGIGKGIHDHVEGNENKQRCLDRCRPHSLVEGLVPEELETTWTLDTEATFLGYQPNYMSEAEDREEQCWNEYYSVWNERDADDTCEDYCKLCDDKSVSFGEAFKTGFSEPYRATGEAAGYTGGVVGGALAEGLTPILEVVTDIFSDNILLFIFAFVGLAIFMMISRGSDE